jgi:hypothetical protein
MPNMKHLLDELEELDVDPRQVKLPGPHHIRQKVTMPEFVQF